MNLRAVAGFALAATTLTSCALNGSVKSVTSPLGSADRATSVARAVFDPPLTARERDREAAVQARIDVKLASGYVFQHTGTVSSMVVRPDGTRTVYGEPGDTVTVSLVPKTNDRFMFHSIRPPGTPSPNGTPVSPCDEACNGGQPGSPAPRTAPTPPPNFSSCSAAGGATWYGSDSGLGGCLGVGASRGLSCGVWAYSSRGRGKLVMKDGTTYDDLSWISDNESGTCQLGW